MRSFPCCASNKISFRTFLPHFCVHKWTKINENRLSFFFSKHFLFFLLSCVCLNVGGWSGWHRRRKGDRWVAFSISPSHLMLTLSSNSFTSFNLFTEPRNLSLVCVKVWTVGTREILIHLHHLEVDFLPKKMRRRKVFWDARAVEWVEEGCLSCFFIILRNQHSQGRDRAMWVGKWVEDSPRH